MQSFRLPPYYVHGKLIFMIQSASEVQELGTLPPEGGGRHVPQLQRRLFILLPPMYFTGVFTGSNDAHKNWWV